MHFYRRYETFKMSALGSFKLNNHFYKNKTLRFKLPVKNCRSLNLPRMSFITLFVFVLNISTWSGLFSWSFSTSLKKKKSIIMFNICMLTTHLIICRVEQQSHLLIKILLLHLLGKLPLLNNNEHLFWFLLKYT